MACGWDVTEELLSIFQDYPDDASNTDDPGIPSDYSEYDIGVKLLKLSVNLRKVMCLAVKPVKVTLIMKTYTKIQSTNKPTHGNQGHGGNFFYLETCLVLDWHKCAVLW
jgi:hypothetical protein